MHRERVLTGQFGELRIEQEMIEVSTALPRPDPRWVYTDEHGHEHRYAPQDGDLYSSLVWVDEEPYWCADCADEHQDGYYECRLCGEVISPGTFVDPTPQYTPGPRQAFLNDEPITGERAEEILAEARGEARS